VAHLPEGYTHSSARLRTACGRATIGPIHGEFLLLNVCERAIPVPRDDYYMAGAGGQTTLMIPRTDIVSCVSGTIERILRRFRIQEK